MPGLVIIKEWRKPGSTATEKYQLKTDIETAMSVVEWATGLVPHFAYVQSGWHGDVYVADAITLPSVALSEKEAKHACQCMKKRLEDSIKKIGGTYANEPEAD